MTGSAEPGGGRLPRLHLVTDDAVLRRPGFDRLAARLFEEGAARVALHVRGHGLTGRELWDRASRAADHARASGAWLIVNDRVDVAMGCGARGVQLGSGSMPIDAAARLLGPGHVIGTSVHDREGARDAVARGADFLLAGTLYPSPTHPGGATTGPEWLADAAAPGRPVIGIGGIDPTRIAPVRAAGAYGVAVVSAVWAAPDPLASLRALLRELDGE